MAIALGDALALVISNELHINVQAVFSKNHPGGAIGQAIQKAQKVSDICISFADIPEVGTTAITGAHVLMSGYQSDSNWVRSGSDLIMAPRRIARLRPDDMDEPATCIPGLIVQSKDWIAIPAHTNLSIAKNWIMSMRSTGESRYGDDAIIAAMVDDEVSGVLEVGTLLA
jgi:hypothetical protein